MKDVYLMKNLTAMFQKGSIYAIASRCGIGKTQFCLDFAKYVAGNGEKVLYLSDSPSGKEIDVLASQTILKGKNNIVCKRTFHLHKLKLEMLLNEDEYDYLILDPFDIYAYDIDMGELKEIAVEKHIAIIVTKSLSRPPLFSRRKYPVLSDIKFANRRVQRKFIAYTDIILFLERKSHTSQFKVLVGKDVHGEIGYSIELIK